jgi:zinc/manganese transport system substrate-binding protein
LETVNKKIEYLFLLSLFILFNFQPAYALIHITAAENVYGETAKQLGGPYVEVISILNNPNQDPHLFSVTPSTAKAVKFADIIIMNGAHYDPWMLSLIQFNKKTQPVLIVLADLIKWDNKKNPHLWYVPQSMVIFAEHLVKQLSIHDPQNSQFYENELNNFRREYQKLIQKMQAIKKTYQGTTVIATEPLFNDMASYMGLVMRGESFQQSIMNDVPPAISDIQQFEDDLRKHRAAVLFYNQQVLNTMTKRMLAIAAEENIPIVGLSETLPKQMTYVQWMEQQLMQVEKALKQGGKPHE